MSNITNNVSLRLCPNCGLELPASGWEGLCPKCLVLVSVRGLPKSERESSFAATGPEIVETGPAAFPSSVGTISLKGLSLDDYELMEEIGRGGMGVVFKARQLSLNRTVALKIVLAGPLAGASRLERFRAEAQAVAHLQHPNIVSIYTVGEHQGAPFFSMEYVPGRTLAELVAERPLAPKVAAHTVQTIAQAVHYAHQRGIVHRDLKPSNVLIDASGHPRITDFGLAKRLPSSVDSRLSTPNSQLTATGQLLGSPSYLAPEQAGTCSDGVGPAADVYALGAILFHLLAGRPPFLSETIEGTLLQVLTTEPVPVRRLNPAVPHDLETICLKCLDKNSSRRYASAEALAEDLRRFLDHAPILAQPTNRAQKLWCWCRRRPALSLSLLLLQLSLATGLAGILWEWLRARASEVSLQQNLYATDVKLAQAALEENNLGRATTLLQRHVPASRRGSDLRGFEWWYLWHLCRGNERATLHERDTIISCVRFSPDGRLIASAGFDGVVTLWNPETHRSIAHLTGLSGPVSRLALSFSLDGKLLAAAGGTNLLVWETDTWKVARSLPAYSAPLGGGGYQLAFTPDSGRLAARLNGDVQVWETTHWQPVLTVSNSVDETASLLAFSPDGKVLAAYNDRHLQFWEAATGHQRNTSVTLIQPLGLAFDQQGFRVAVVDASGMLRILDAQTGLSLLSVQGLTGLAQCVAFSPDGAIVATGGSDQLIRLWDSTSLTNIATLKGHQSEVWSIAFSPDAKLLVSASKDGTLKLWEVKPAPGQVRTLNEESFPDCFSTDSKVLLTRRGNGSLHFWDIETGQQRRVIPPLQIDGERYFTTVSLDGKYLATSVEDGRIFLWDLPTGTCVHTNRVDVNPPNALAFSPGNRQLAFSTGRYLGADWKGVTGLLDLASGGIRILASDFAGTRDCACLAFSPDGKSLAGAGPDYTIHIWDLASGSERRLLRGHAWSVKSLAFSPDGKLLASGSDDNTARLWDVATGGLLAVLAGHETGIVQVRFSPDGRTLATSGNDRTLRLWNIATRRELLTLKLATRWTHFLFSPDGRLLASGGLSGPLEIWRAPEAN